MNYHRLQNAFPLAMGNPLPLNALNVSIFKLHLGSQPWWLTLFTLDLRRLAGSLLRSRPAWATEWLAGQPCSSHNSTNFSAHLLSEAITTLESLLMLLFLLFQPPRC